ncbi:hypothetical protein TYRP_020204, partial [Tyrophagus putrescentiae]
NSANNFELGRQDGAGRQQQTARAKAAASEQVSEGKKYIGAIDQGTSSSRFILFPIDEDSTTTGTICSQKEIPKITAHGKTEWVEQCPEAIFQSVVDCIEDVVGRILPAKGGSAEDILTVGITNQRESTILWDRATGKPLYNSIVWLDNRASELVSKILKEKSATDIAAVKAKTGLTISSYFSALKIRWLLENVPEVRAAAKEHRLAFGTVDSWLCYRLTGGARHITDVTNASRTLLMDLETLRWDPFLCEFFGIPMSILPAIEPCAAAHGIIAQGPLAGLRIDGIIGDQQAALVGQRCLAIGQMKITYGTGGFIVQNIGPGPLHGALKAGGAPWYALEGSIAVAGSAITWLRNNLGVVKSYEEVEPAAASVPDSGGIVFVPALQGILYAPFWDSNATSAIFGCSFNTSPGHIVRATLESVAFSTQDIISLMFTEGDGGGPETDEPTVDVETSSVCSDTQPGIRIDGGMTKNTLFCQILANITGHRILRSANAESTALGAAMVAGYLHGHWETFGRGLGKKKPRKPIPPRFSKISQNGNGPVPNGKANGTTTLSPAKANGHVPNGITTASTASPKQPPNSNIPKPLIEQLEGGGGPVEVFTSQLDEKSRQAKIRQWHEAVKRCLRWNRHGNEELIEYLRLAVLPFGGFIVGAFAMVIIGAIRHGGKGGLL